MAVLTDILGFNYASMLVPRNSTSDAAESKEPPDNFIGDIVGIIRRTPKGHTITLSASWIQGLFRPVGDETVRHVVQQIQEHLPQGWTCTNDCSDFHFKHG